MNELESFRRRECMSQATLAGHLGVAPNTLARWERGDMTPPGKLLHLSLRMLALDLEERRRTMSNEEQHADNLRRQRYYRRTTS